MTANTLLYTHKLIPSLLVGYFTIGYLVYWLGFLYKGWFRVTEDPCYIIFQKQFVVSDLVTGIAGLICLVGLFRGALWAQVLGGVFAGGVLFLGCMDISFNVNEGYYAKLSKAIKEKKGDNSDFIKDMKFECFTNFMCIFIAACMIWYLI